MAIWTAEAEARIFACVLVLKDIKLSKEDFNEISNMMEGEFSGEAIRQRVTKKIKKSYDGTSPKKPTVKEAQVEMVSPGKKSKSFQDSDLKKKDVSAKKRRASAFDNNDPGEDEVAVEEDSPSKKVPSKKVPSKTVKTEPKDNEDTNGFMGLLDPYDF